MTNRHCDTLGVGAETDPSAVRAVPCGAGARDCSCAISPMCLISSQVLDGNPGSHAKGHPRLPNSQQEVLHRGRQ
jgi:hypothetical protein